MSERSSPLLRVGVRTKGSAGNYDISIGRNTLSETGKVARGCLNKEAVRLVVVSNHRVFELYGDSVTKSLRASKFQVFPFTIPKGEAHKSLNTVEKIVRFFAWAGLERTDAVVALGGGVVGDVAGFAAAIYLRGIPFIQIPTTLLAQIDASVGGKTGANLPSGKNLVGAFHQPRAVLIDVATLATLPFRELVSGRCEMLKQSAVASRRLYNQTIDFLKESESKDSQVPNGFEQLVAAHCKFKSSIVAGDERENVNRKDHRSRRILNFGHTIAHALETLTNYRRFRHGEAVGHGILVAGELSKNLSLLEQSELESLREGVRLCGRLPRADDLAAADILKALASDKKRVGGKLRWVLLERIGRPRIVDGKEITPRLLKQSLHAALLSNPLRS